MTSPTDDVVTLGDPRLKAPTAAGETVTREFTGYTARVVQHEIDHLDGLVYLDRMPDLTSLTTAQNYLDHHRPAPS